jgi:hypothetical protein
MDDPVVAFYSGGRDDRGRTVEDILGWSDNGLEAVHDYIQWLFPGRSPSAVNASAPLVTTATEKAFAEGPELRARLAASFDRMLAFYGLRRVTGSPGTIRIEIDRASFPRQAANWLRPGNHNHLRLTRIMQSLAALGLRSEARALQRCLIADIAEGPGRNRITSDTIGFWQAAC